MMNTLEELISPIKTDDFFKSYWESKYLYINRNNKDYYKKLITFDEIIEYVNQDDIRYPAVRLVKDGLSIPLEDYTTDITLGAHEFSSLVNHDRLNYEVQNGSTIQFQYLHLAVKSLQQLCSNLGDVYRMHIQANAYLTPPKSQGFDAHYDTHGVFILQIYGEKIWKLYGTAYDFPLKNHRFKKEKWDESSLSESILLQEGDLLYIPRGMVHEAFTSNNLSSFHITLGILPTNWVDIFKELLETLEDNKEFRKALPYDGSKTAIDENLFVEQFKLLLAEISSTANPMEFWHKRVEKLRVKQSSSDPLRLKNILTNQIADKDSSFIINKNIRTNVQVEDENFSIYFYNKKVTLPIAVLPSINTILESNQSFNLSDLQSNLSDNSKLIILKKLQTEGLINIITPQTEPDRK